MSPDDSVLALLLDPMFRRPLLTGLLLACSLSLLGAGLRLRQQWLSAIGVSQMAAAGGVAAALLHGPLLLGALLGAGSAGAVRALCGTVRNEHYAVMWLAGWALTLLLAAHAHHGELAAQWLLNGQLYFTEAWHLWSAVLLITLLLLLGSWLSKRLLLQRLFPDHFSANRQTVWQHELCFEAFIVAAVVLSIVAMGVMATFAMLFAPAWIAFGLMRGWRAAIVVSLLLGVLAYVLGYLMALSLDLPFGPSLVAVAVALLPLRLIKRRPRAE